MAVHTHIEPLISSLEVLVNDATSDTSSSVKPSDTVSKDISDVGGNSRLKAASITV